MIRRALWAAAVVLVMPAPHASGQAQEARTVVSGLEFPTGIAFHPDGRMFINERGGRIRVFRNGRLRARPLATIPTVVAGETGLLGSALHPDGDDLYVFATHPDGDTNRVWRVPLAGGRPRVVIEGLPAALYHNGGGVEFDPDGMLLVSNGERHEGERAQDPAALGGKVYRFTDTGEIPEDNPFGGSAAVAIGLRNPFGLTVDPVSGAAFVTENGPESFDEIDRIHEGGNYGWPAISGPRSGESTSDLPGDYRDPVAAYEQIVVPTGLAFAPPEESRPGFAGDLFFGTFQEGTIRRLRLDGSRTRAVSDEVFLRPGPVVAVEWGPRGLYFSTPEAVGVVPIARERPAQSPTSQSPSPTATAPQPEPTGRPAGDRSEIPTGGVVIAVLAGAAVAALLYAFYRWKVRRDR